MASHGYRDSNSFATTKMTVARTSRPGGPGLHPLQRQLAFGVLFGRRESGPDELRAVCSLMLLSLLAGAASRVLVPESPRMALIDYSRNVTFERSSNFGETPAGASQYNTTGRPRCR
jgi:hypothetical protein